MRSGGAIHPPPPPKKVSQRYLRDTPMKQGKLRAIPPLRYYLERVLREYGGYLHWATKLKQWLALPYRLDLLKCLESILWLKRGSIPLLQNARRPVVDTFSDMSLYGAVALCEAQYLKLRNVW